jgi:hypothetical protein
MNIHFPNSHSGRNMTDMEILENPLEWLRDFQEGWLATYESTGIADWSLYASPNNRISPSSNSIRRRTAGCCWSPPAGHTTRASTSHSILARWEITASA